MRSIEDHGFAHPVGRTIEAVAVTVPVCDEELLLAASLRSVVRAVEQVSTALEAVSIVVVLDGCTDRSGEIAKMIAASLDPSGSVRLVVVESSLRNVGAARAEGIRQALAGFDRFAPDRIWLATTDADSQVPLRWLKHQLAQHRSGVDGWAGTVTVDDWSQRSVALPGAFAHDYRHGDQAAVHVHGANLGVGAGAYLRAGGFPSWSTGEDHGLWRALGSSGAHTVHDSNCPVVTSSRQVARAPAGFAAALDDLESVRQ